MKIHLKNVWIIYSFSYITLIVLWYLIGLFINSFDLGGGELISANSFFIVLLYLFILILNPFFAGQLTKRILKNSDIKPEKVDKPVVVMYILTILFFLFGAKIFNFDIEKIFEIRW